MKRHLFTLSIFLIGLLLSGCGEENSTVSTTGDSDERSTIVSESLVNIPSSLSDTTSYSSGSSTGLYAKLDKGLSTAPNTEDEPVWKVYEGIRVNIAALEVWTSIIEELTGVIYQVIGQASSGDWSNNNSDPSEPSRIVWGPSSNSEYDVVMELYFGGAKGFEAFLKVNESTREAKGIYTWDFSIVPNSKGNTNSAKIQFAFDSSAEPKILSIKMVNMFGSGATNTPTHAWVEVTESSNEIVTVWGNYFFPTLDMFEDQTGDAAESRSYVFAGVGYSETGQSTTNRNKAIVNLAIPPSGTTSTSGIWLNNSVSAIFVNKIKEIWAASPMTYSDLVNWTSATPPTVNLTSGSIAGLTYNEVIEVLDWAYQNDGTGDSELDSLIFVTKLVNSAYFDSDGFEATCLDASNDGNCEQGTVSTVPSGYDSLDISPVLDDVEAPSTVKDLHLTLDFLK